MIAWPDPNDITEWVELIEAGVNVLVGADKGRIMQGISRMMEKEIDSSSAIYGHGDAAEKMVEILAQQLTKAFS